MPRIRFGEWLPDQQFIDSPGMTEAKNVFPVGFGYKPFPSPTGTTAETDDRCQGAFGTTSPEGTGVLYAGDATKLYRYAAGAFVDASRLVGGAYTTPSTAMWRFAAYGTLGIAVNGFDAPQSITLEGGTNFAALGGSPPVARYIAPVREFVFLGALSSGGGDLKSVMWSASGSAIGWTVGTGECDMKTFAGGGLVTGISGGESAYIFQERQITRATRVSAPVSWQLDTVETDRGCYVPGSLQKLGSGAFYLSSDGFYLFDGASSTPIGVEKIDRFFFEGSTALNEAYLERVCSAIDPARKLYIVAYPSVNSADGALDSALVFNYALNRWSRLDLSELSQTMEWLGTLVTPATTLDDLDSISGSLDAIMASLDARIWQGGLQNIAFFSSLHQFMTVEANSTGASTVLTTGDTQVLPGKRSFVNKVYPITTGDTTATAAVGSRERATATVAYTSEASIASDGSAGCLASGRFHRVRVSADAPAGTTIFQGVDVSAQPDGD